MNRSLLVETSCYLPSLCAYLNKKETEIVESEVGKAIVWKEELNSYEQCTTMTIINQSCKEGRDWIVYDILDSMVYLSTELLNCTAQLAATNGRKELVLSMVNKGANTLTWIASCAIKAGHRDIAKKLVELGADSSIL